METAKRDIRSLSQDQMVQFFEANGEKAFRAKQVYQWLWQKSSSSFDEMTNLSKSTRALLEAHFYFNLLEVEDIDLSLTIKFNKVSVDLNINESLIVINTLAVKRAALRGGLWSTAGKQTEGPLMVTICRLYNVPEENYSIKPRAKRVRKGDVSREVDFYLHENNNTYKCEVKLMGKGNPESADAVIARDSKVFVADKLSDQNKTQLDNLNVEWVELRDDNGFRRFEQVLDKLNIPYSTLSENLDIGLKKVLKNLFKLVVV